MRRWAAQRMAETIRSASAHRAVYGLAITRSRLSVDWRTELLTDLGDPPVPPMPDDRFWGALRNPDVNVGHYASRCAAEPA